MALGIDANLLLALDALLRERSVTRAARALGLGQPGMSHALGRLRAHFGDPLLVRKGAAMVLTPRARSLAAPAEAAVQALQGVFDQRDVFTPATARRLFRIATTDHVGFLLLPPLMERLGREAPGVDLDVRAITEHPVPEALGEGTVDLAIGVFDQVPSGLRRQALFQERFTCLVRKDHPGVGATMSLEEYLALGHVLVAPRGTREGAVDRALGARKLARRVALTIPHFLLAARIVAHSDLVVTLAERLAEHFVRMAGVRRVEPPLPLERYTLSQLWHEQHHADAGHRWLRQEVFRAARAIDRGNGRDAPGRLEGRDRERQEPLP